MPHLRDLFKDGEEVIVKDNSGNEYVIWVVRPSSLQQEEARAKANGKMSRMKLAALKKEGDRYDSLYLAFAELTEHDDLVATRVTYEENDARDLAYNEVLYGTGDGEMTEWEKDDKYFGLIKGISDRLSDIAKYNEQMKEAESVERITEDEDEELQTLFAEQERFRDLVKERVDLHLKEEKELQDIKTDEELREELMALALDLEAKMMWYEAFQNRMLYYACRYDDDRKKFYFENEEEVLEIPEYVRSQLYRAYENVERGSDDLKNSLSLPSS